MKYTMIVHMKYTGATLKQVGYEMSDEDLHSQKFLDPGPGLAPTLVAPNGHRFIIATADISYVELIPEPPIGDAP
jgi:hypothetical protein